MWLELCGMTSCHVVKTKCKWHGAAPHFMTIHIKILFNMEHVLFFPLFNLFFFLFFGFIKYSQTEKISVQNSAGNSQHTESSRSLGQNVCLGIVSCEGREMNWSISFPTTTESEWQGKYSTDLVSSLIRWQAVRFGQSSTLQNCSFKALGWKWRFSYPHRKEQIQEEISYFCLLLELVVVTLRWDKAIFSRIQLKTNKLYVCLTLIKIRYLNSMFFCTVIESWSLSS